MSNFLFTKKKTKRKKNVEKKLWDLTKKKNLCWRAA